MTDAPAISVVYRSEHAYVTDNGAAPLDITTAAGAFVCHLPRYTVWRAVGGRHQVTLTTDDVDEARRAADDE